MLRPQGAAVSPKRDKSRTTKSRTGSRKRRYSQSSELAAPLSVLTESSVAWPVRDMEPWVNRSPDVRRNESAQQDGYVKRPLNAFLLYRMAYSVRTMIWYTENHQQTLSKLLGCSWVIETSEIRARYENLAAVEKRNHMEAFSSYRSLPRRPNTSRWSVDREALCEHRMQIWRHWEAYQGPENAMKVEMTEAPLHSALQLRCHCIHRPG
jgi:hypothetical protein